MAACRTVSLARELKLINAAVIRFEKDVLTWQRSDTLDYSIAEAEAADLLAEARQADPCLFRKELEDKRILCTSIVPAQPPFTTLFIQVLPSALAGEKTLTERLIELELQLSGQYPDVPHCLQPRVGWFNGARACDLTPQEAAEAGLSHVTFFFRC